MSCSMAHGNSKDWNPEAIIATLRDQANKLFKIKFVRKGSLIMLTTISASILSDSELFEAAVMSFLTKMMEDCDINTEIPGRVEVKLHILNANEVAITKNEFESKYYKIKSGLVLVLNNKEFHVPGECLGDRAGSDIDASSIVQRFSELGFECELKQIYLNLLLLNVKRQLITNPVDCFVLVILSHGTENGVYATDGLMKTVDIVECFNATNCRQLRLKPKVVIIQSSRDRIRSNVNLIDRNTPDCPADLSDYNDWSDAFTNAAEVTPFIRHLSKAIGKMEENEDFCSVLTTVNKTVGMAYKTNTGEAKLNNEVQMPCFVSHLTKSLRLSPLRFDG
ncbi:CASP6 [Mytilus edulis]|uniref:CASP6 n=1 Tax=Mytilus edulis TaxID=6550 RepID=A0A8S3T4S5_MYTED|nr:CASP6 [Mytilus edulis]